METVPIFMIIWQLAPLFWLGIKTGARLADTGWQRLGLPGQRREEPLPPGGFGPELSIFFIIPKKGFFRNGPGGKKIARKGMESLQAEGFVV